MRHTRFAAACLLAGWAALMQGCGPKTDAAPPPPPSVTVATPVVKRVVEWDVFTGHLEAVQQVTVAARVSGLIESEPFVEGALVKQGQPLFVLDPSPFQADFDTKLAAIAKDQAQILLAQTNFDRAEQAVKQNAISRQDYDTAKQTLAQAQAVLKGDQAAAESSRLNLQWTTVIAPVAGRVGNKLVTLGNLINGGAGQATTLTTITSIDPIYCYVDVDEQSIIKYQRLAKEKKRISARDQPIPTYLQLSDEKNFPHAGMVDFVDNHIDPGTGTLRARGVFPNPGGYLYPGEFARIRIAGSGEYDATLIPDDAIGTDQNEKVVMVVGPDNVVQRRVVTVGALFGDLRSVVTGLDPQDTLVIKGLLRIRPGVKVEPMRESISMANFDHAGGDIPTSEATPATEPATQAIDPSRDTAATQASGQRLPEIPGLPSPGETQGPDGHPLTEPETGPGAAPAATPPTNSTTPR